MGASEWLHRDTVCLIDCVNQHKKEGKWSVQDRQVVAEDVREQLQERNATLKPIGKILNRIATLGKQWTTDAHHLALYRRGWAAMKEKCSRGVLMDVPNGMYNPAMPVRIPFDQASKRSYEQPSAGHNTSGMNEIRSTRKAKRALVSGHVPRRAGSSSESFDIVPLTPRIEVESLRSSSLSLQAHSETSVASIMKPLRSPSRPLEGQIPIEALEDFLGNADRYLSTRRGVEGAHSSLMSIIDDAVRRLLRTSRTLFEEEPILTDFKSPLVFKVLQYIYGAEDESHLRNILRLHYDQASLTIGQLLMVMLAAAVSNWVFEKQFDEVLRDPTEREKNQTEIWTARFFPAFSEQHKRIERFDYVSAKIGWEKIAERLSDHFFFGTMSFLKVNLKLFKDGMAEWSESIRMVFCTALELEGQLMLWGPEVTVFWPAFDTKFNSNLMVLNERHAQGSEERIEFLRVRATSFPAIIESKSIHTVDSVGSQGLVLKASVFVQ